MESGGRIDIEVHSVVSIDGSELMGRLSIEYGRSIFCSAMKDFDLAVQSASMVVMLSLRAEGELP